ncbi:NAD(P)H oxidoreductase [Aneurinibacillus sp. REN35]|uniref:NAD(P)H oxidoreductase n=1 Tax=Aneurinibacillus sp. REN35 TaxID=3237286 RepID=UPI0035281864
MRTLIIVAHPRKDSLTFAVASHFMDGLKDAGHKPELLDLYQEEFNPVLFEQDEPTWGQPDKEYSVEVHRRIDQMKQNDALAFIFPIWWWNMPAIMKGYIDRVWNYGFAYGLHDDNKLLHEKVLWIGLVGAPEERFKRYKYDEMLHHYFNVGLASYTGIKDSKVEFLYDTVKGKRSYFEKEIISRAYDLGVNY